MIYKFHSTFLDTERLEITRDGQVISVQPQVFALLSLLIEHRDRVLTKDEIIAAVWDGRAISDSALNARINAARRAVNDSGETQAIIKTFPRRGFRFVADLENEPTIKAPDTQSADANPTRSGPSIAVLPFSNLSGDSEQAYFADGLTEDLITDLSKIRALFVIARHTSFTYRDAERNLVDIGRELGVQTVLEGSVRKAGNKVRINAQLVDAETGGHLWAERYDGELDDIFDLQDQISRKIIAALQINLSTPTPSGRQTNSAAAYELSLRGRAKFFMFSAQHNAECIGLLEQAVRLDPGFARAWSEQVFPYQSGWSFGWQGYDDGLQIAETKARKAVALDPSASLGYSRLGWVETFLRQPEAAIASFEKAIDLDPNTADTYVWFSESLNFCGYPERAIDVGLTALKFDPVAPPNCYSHIGHAHYLLGHLDEAERYIAQALQTAPTFPVARVLMAATLAELGRTNDGRAHVAALLDANSTYNFRTYDDRYPYQDAKHRTRMHTALSAVGLI